MADNLEKFFKDKIAKMPNQEVDTSPKEKVNSKTPSKPGFQITEEVTETKPKELEIQYVTVFDEINQNMIPNKCNICNENFTNSENYKDHVKDIPEDVNR